MTALTLIETISLEILVSGTLDRSKIGRQIDALGPSMSDEASRLLYQAFCAAVAQEPGTPGSVKTALDSLEQLSRYLRAGPAAKRKAAQSAAALSAVVSQEVLKYDTSMGADVLETFFAEYNVHLQNVEQQLLILEREPANSEALQSAFRAFHSLKGNCGFLELSMARDLAHEAETILDQARSGARMIDPATCDVFLHTVDSLREIGVLLLQHCKTAEGPFPAIPRSCEPVLVTLRKVVATRFDFADAPKAELQLDEEPALHPTAAPRESRGTTLSLDNASLVRVHVSKLDSLLDAVGELAVAQTATEQDAVRMGLQQTSLTQNLGHLRKIIRQLQMISLSMRAFPLRDTFQRMTRMARDIARRQQKDIEVNVSGEETEMDKNVLEALADPLLHLIRNAIDHGVESPMARVSAGKPRRDRDLVRQAPGRQRHRRSQRRRQRPEL